MIHLGGGGLDDGVEKRNECLGVGAFQRLTVDVIEEDGELGDEICRHL